MCTWVMRGDEALWGPGMGERMECSLEDVESQSPKGRVGLWCSSLGGETAVGEAERLSVAYPLQPLLGCASSL